MNKDILGMIENRVSSIASLLSEKSNCKVVLTKNSSIPHTDLETGTIYIPPIQIDSLSYGNLCVFRRHLDHESFHVRYTPPDQYAAAQAYIESQVSIFDSSLAGLSVNIVEDCRIDNILWSKFPGSRTSSIEAFKIYLESLADSDLDDAIQIAHVVLYGVKGIENILDLRSVYKCDIVDGLNHGGFLRGIVQEVQDTVLNKPISSIFEPSLSLYNLIADYKSSPSLSVPDVGTCGGDNGSGDKGDDGSGSNDSQVEGVDSGEGSDSDDSQVEGVDSGEGSDSDGSQVEGVDSDEGSIEASTKRVSVSHQEWESVSLTEIISSKIESISQCDVSKVVNLTDVSLCKIKPTVPYNPAGTPYSTALMRCFRSLKGIDNTDTRRSLRRGRIDPKSLYKVGFGDYNVFSKNDSILDRNVGVCVLLDLSNSMFDVYPQVASTTVVLGNLFQSLGVSFNILGYTNKGFIPKSYDSFVPYNGERVFVESSLDLYVLKTFDENFKAVWRRVGSSIFSIFKTGLSGATPTAAALLESAELLYSQRSLHKRVLMHVTDGHPTDIVTNGCGSFVEPEPVVRGILDTLEKDNDFLCLGIGLGAQGIEAVEVTHGKYVKVPDIYNITDDIIEGFERSVLSLYGK